MIPAEMFNNVDKIKTLKRLGYEQMDDTLAAAQVAGLGIRLGLTEQILYEVWVDDKGHYVIVLTLRCSPMKVIFFEPVSLKTLAEK